MFTFYIKCFRKSYVCMYLIANNSKILCGIAQLDVGYVIVCSAERKKELFGIVWPSVDGQGRYIKGTGKF